MESDPTPLPPHLRMVRNRRGGPTNFPIPARLLAACTRKQLTLADLAARTARTEAQISYLETAKRRPECEDLGRLSQDLDRPLQYRLTRTTRPGTYLPEPALELRSYGVSDLVVNDPVAPGAFRPVEEVVALALSGTGPEPRVVEAFPFVLACNAWNPHLPPGAGGSDPGRRAGPWDERCGIR
jgi:transcriptional regulator with XRE-family HTH domain